MKRLLVQSLDKVIWKQNMRAWYIKFQIWLLKSKFCIIYSIFKEQFEDLRKTFPLKKRLEIGKEHIAIEKLRNFQKITIKNILNTI